MSVGEYCNREVVVVSQSESVHEAVKLMRHNHVGDVVVVDYPGDLAKPVGILTDRDIVLEILAEDVSLDDVNIGDVMSGELVTVEEDTPLLEALETMKDNGVRRLPIVDAEGHLAGLLALDDILELVAEQLDTVISLVSREQRHEQKKRN